MSFYKLYLKLDESLEDDIKDYYQKLVPDDDSGIDLLISDTIKTEKNKITKINHKVSCMMVKNTNGVEKPVAFWLLPRSSISKTNYRMANSVGLIDSGYRGHLIAKVDNYISDGEISKNTRMFQIANGDLENVKEICIVSELPDSKRGSGGFGSTGGC